MKPKNEEIEMRIEETLELQQAQVRKGRFPRMWLKRLICNGLGNYPSTSSKFVECRKFLNIQQNGRWRDLALEFNPKLSSILLPTHPQLKSNRKAKNLETEGKNRIRELVLPQKA